MNEEALTELIARKPELKAAKSKLEAMQPGSYCIHQSWGFGQIKDYDEADQKLVIDFEGKTEHRMDPGFCIGTMQILPPEHLLVRKQTEPEEIESMLANRQADLVVELLRQYPNNAASVPEVESMLAQVVGPAKFKKWWTSAKKVLQKDPRIAVPSRKTGMFALRPDPVSAEEEIIEDYNATQSAKRHIALAEKLLETAKDKPELKDQLAGVLHTLASAVKDSNQITPAERLRGAWVRDDLARILEIDVASFEPSLADLVSDPSELQTLIAGLPNTLHARALELVRESHPAQWKELVFGLLKNSSGKLTTDAVNFLLERVDEREIADTLKRWLAEQNLKEPVLLWIVKNRHSRKYGSLVRDLIQPRLLNAIFFAIDYEALQSSGARRIPLADVLSEDPDIIPDLLSQADPETAKDLANSLLVNQGFEDLTKKSLLARFIKLFPGVQQLLESEQESKAEGLLVSSESYDRVVAEYEELVSKKIPENSRAIAEAREHGDLRENSEYKMAKQDQQFLMARRAQLESDIQRAQITDFSDAAEDTVGIGSVVTLIDETRGRDVTYTILGAWDSDPENQIISYQTPLGKSLLAKRVGDEVALNIDNTESKLRVKSIGRYVDLVSR